MDKPTTLMTSYLMPSAVSSHKKILFVHPILKPIGGGEVVAAWILEALKDEHDVSVLPWEPIETAELNGYYGTSLGASDFTVLTPPRLLRCVIDWVTAIDGDPYSIQPYSILMRLAKRIRHAYADHRHHRSREGVR